MPYPANLARIEYAAGDLCERQADVTKAFQEIVKTARTAIAALEFPLGSPARCYDLKDIDDTLGDWLTPRSDDLLEADALELASQDAANQAADYADWRRHNVYAGAGAAA